MRRPVYNSLMSEKQFGDNLQYHNITISGLPGCGSTTLLNGLRQLLSPYGWRGFSGGEFMRAYAQEKGLWDKKNAAHHDANVYSDEFDREVDFGIREKLQQQKQWIIESWLSGFMAQQLPGVLKVLLVCHSDDVRIDRVMNRDQVSAETAKENTLYRYQTNLDKFSRLYAAQWQEWLVDTGKLSASEAIDFWRRELYDVVIDTYYLSKEESVAKVLAALKGEEI